MLESSVKDVEMLHSIGVGVVTVSSPGYPRALAGYKLSGRIYRPLVLYVKPPVSLDGLFVAVVGTRSCTEWGRRMARLTGRIIAEAGFTIVTGLAECIDVEAMRGALEAGGLAVGVRPWLEPLTLPVEARRLLEEYGDRVAVVAEHYRRPRRSIKMLYYLRNRIIAGMSELVVVVEARPGGGSMHQLVWALKAGKPLVVYEHPQRGSEYYRAYEIYVESGAKTIKTPDELKNILNEIKHNSTFEPIIHHPS